jgi:hypothetical protein
MRQGLGRLIQCEFSSNDGERYEVPGGQVGLAGTVNLAEKGHGGEHGANSVPIYTCQSGPLRGEGTAKDAKETNGGRGETTN